MSLEFHTVPIAFTDGQDTRTQQKLIAAGKWQQLINYSLSKDGTPVRRDGSAQLVPSIVGNGLATRGTELVAINGSAASAYTPATAGMTAVAGKYSNVGVAVKEVLRAAGLQDSLDCAMGNGMICYVWRDTTPTPGAIVNLNGCKYMIVDAVTGSVISQPAVFTPFLPGLGASTNMAPRVVFADNAFFLFWLLDNFPGNLTMHCRVVTTAAPTAIGADTTLITDAKLSTLNFDAVAFGTAAVAVSYVWIDATTSVRTIKVTRSGTTPSAGAPVNTMANATVDHTTIVALGIAVSGSLLGVFVTTIAGGLIKLWGSTLTTSYVLGSGANQLDSVATGVAFGRCNVAACGDGITSFFVCFDQQNAFQTVGFNPLRAVLVTSVMATVSAVTTINSSSFDINAARASGPQGPWIVGKPFIAGSFSGASGACYLPVAMMENYTGLGTNVVNNNTQNTLFILEIASGSTLNATASVVGKALYGAYGAPTPSPSSNPHVGEPASTIALSGITTSLPVGQQGFFSTFGGVTYTLSGISRLDLTPNQSLPAIRGELGPVAFLSGGQLSVYDGLQMAEHGFPMYPEGVSVAVHAAAGACTAGVHQVVVVYEWIDGQGHRAQSSPSQPVSWTSAGADFCDIIVPTLQLSQKASGLTLGLYMTTANGTTFFRANSTSSTIANLTTASIVATSISLADATLSANEALYIQPLQAGSTLPNDAPPPCKALCVSQNRLWILSADNDLEYRFSQELLNGFGLQFFGIYGQEDLGGLVPSESGGTVAVSSLDEKTIILCNRKLYVIFGGGPDSSGSNSTLSGPQEIPSPVGCIDARSVLQMPQGLIFKAQSGFYLLGRDLSVQYIGDGVKQYDSYTVVSATLMRDRQECRWEAAFAPTDPNSGDGVVLVFSYLTGQWSVFLRGSNFLHPKGATDAMWYPPLNKYVWLATSLGSNSNIVGLFNDVPNVAGSPTDDYQGSGLEQPVPTVAVTAWLKVSGLEGFQRVRRLYITATPLDSANPLNTGFRISTSVNDNPTPVDNILPALTSTGTPVDLRHKLPVQKVKSIRFAFTEAGSLGANVLSGIQAMALEIGLKKGVNKLQASQTV